MNREEMIQDARRLAFLQCEKWLRALSVRPELARLLGAASRATKDQVIRASERLESASNRSETTASQTMPAEWTGELIGKMHVEGITAIQLAEEVGWHPKYLSAVLNGHKAPKNAEEKLRAGLDAIMNKRVN